MELPGNVGKVVKLIRELIPRHPEILRMKNPFDLFKIDEFQIPSHFQLSLYQAQWALKKAQQEWSDEQPDE